MKELCTYVHIQPFKDLYLQLSFFTIDKLEMASGKQVWTTLKEYVKLDSTHVCDVKLLGFNPINHSYSYKEFSHPIS